MNDTQDSCAQIEDDDYIKVSADGDDEFVEIPKEEDGTVMLSTIKTQFPDVIGLKFKGSSGAWRAIRSVDNILVAPKGGWGDQTYIVTLSESRKRKSDLLDNVIDLRSTDMYKFQSQDMAVIGLPYVTSTDELKEYFESNFGETAYCEVKCDRANGKSRGFGFVRFKEIEIAKVVANAEHFIGGRRVVVKPKDVKPMKMFIGCLPNGITKENLEDYFSKFGDLNDVYIPMPYRNFAFITFASMEDGRRVLQEPHMLDGSRLNVEERKNTTVTEQSAEHVSSVNGRNSNDGYSSYKSAKPAADSNNKFAERSDLKSMIFEFLTKS